MAVTDKEYKTVEIGEGMLQGSEGRLFVVKANFAFDRRFVFDRRRQYLERTCQLYASYNADVRICASCQLTPYRVYKIDANTQHAKSWACYDFSQYRDVPEDWYITRNNIYESESWETWHDPTVITSAYERKKYLQDYSRRFILDKSWS